MLRGSNLALMLHVQILLLWDYVINDSYIYSECAVRVSRHQHCSGISTKPPVFAQRWSHESAGCVHVYDMDLRTSLSKWGGCMVGTFL